MKKNSGYKRTPLIKNIKNYTKSALRQDISNMIKYGKSAPRYAEELWIRPEECMRFIPYNFFINCGILKKGDKMRANSGKVHSGFWPTESAIHIHTAMSDEFAFEDYSNNDTPGFVSLFKFRACYNHWVKGLSWNETGIYDYHLFCIKKFERPVDHGCLTKADIVSRYDRLDVIFSDIQREGRFKNPYELGRSNFRGRRGIYIHIGPNGEVFWGQGGQHRFAMAHILNLPFPAMLGVTDVSSISTLKELRHRS